MLSTSISIASVDSPPILLRPLAPMALTMKSGDGVNVAAYPGLHRVKAKGRYYYYAWRGGPRLPDPIDQIAFNAAWMHAHSKTPRQAGGVTFSGLMTQYLESPEWERLGTETRRVRGYRIKAIREEFGELSLEAIQAQEITSDFWDWRDGMRDRPKAADDHIETLNVILNWAQVRGKITINRAAGIGSLYSVDRSEIIFTDAEIDAILAASSADLRRAILVLLETGLRRGDACGLRYGDIRNGRTLERRTNKSRGQTCTLIRLWDELRALLGEGPPDAHILTLKGRPWTPRSLSNRFDYACARAGVKGKHLHDLRGNAATRLFARFSDDRVIEDWMGWKPGQAKEMRKRYAARSVIVDQMAA